MDGPPDTPQPSGVVAERGVVEVYPAGALAMWGLPHKGYKPRGASGPWGAKLKRQEIVAGIESAGGPWLSLPDDVRETLISSDHAVDAFVASLVACAAATNGTVKPLLGRRGAAQPEGCDPPPVAGLDPQPRARRCVTRVSCGRCLTVRARCHDPGVRSARVPIGEQYESCDGARCIDPLGAASVGRHGKHQGPAPARL